MNEAIGYTARPDDVLTYHTTACSPRGSGCDRKIPVGLTRRGNRAIARTIFRTLPRWSEQELHTSRARRKQGWKKHPRALFAKRPALSAQVHRPVDDRHQRESREEDSSFDSWSDETPITKVTSHHLSRSPCDACSAFMRRQRFAVQAPSGTRAHVNKRTPVPVTSDTGKRQWEQRNIHITTETRHKVCGTGRKTRNDADMRQLGRET